MKFWIVDVFARGRAGTGNPLAVVAHARAEAPSTARMQAIAAQFGFSETTFVATEADAEGRWPVRIFTPREELPFAGHPTLGSAFVVSEHLRFQLGSRVELALGVGNVTVDTEPDGARWLTSPPVSSREVPQAAELLSQWQIEAADVDDRYPLSTLATGAVYSVVPMRSLEALERLTPLAQAPGHLYAIARDPEAKDRVRVRMFAPALGVPEDPATGSAACCLGRYLLDTDYLEQGPTLTAQVLQGQEIGRPSLLRLTAQRDVGGQERIRVGGEVRPFAQGELSEA